jgi:hypothetical protein
MLTIRTEIIRKNQKTTGNANLSFNKKTVQSIARFFNEFADEDLYRHPLHYFEN